MRCRDAITRSCARGHEKDLCWIINDRCAWRLCYTGCNDVLSYVDAHISCMHVCVCEDMCLDAHTYLYKSVYTFFLRYYIHIYIYIYMHLCTRTSTVTMPSLRCLCSTWFQSFETPATTVPKTNHNPVKPQHHEPLEPGAPRA